MIRIDNENLYIPKGTSKNTKYAKYSIEEIFHKQTYCGVEYYDTIKHLSTRSYCDERLCQLINNFIVQLAEYLDITLEEDVLNRSLGPAPNDKTKMGEIYDISDLVDLGEVY